MTDLTACREAFEKWFSDSNLICKGDAWKTWRAALNTRADQGGEAVAWMRTDEPVSWYRSFIPASAKPMDPNNTYNVPLYTHPPRAPAVEDAMRELAATFRRVAPIVIASQETVYLYAAAQIEKALSAQRGEDK